MPDHQNAAAAHDTSQVPTTTSFGTPGASGLEWLARLHRLHGRLVAEPTLAGRIALVLESLVEIGFDRAVLTVRDAALEPIETHVRGLGTREAEALREAVGGGVVWRRRFDELGRFRNGRGFLLDPTDPWIVRELGDELAGLLVPPGDGVGHGAPVFLLPLNGSGGFVLGTLLLAREPGAPAATGEEMRLAELIAQHITTSLEEAELSRVARRRGERLQRLQSVGATLARSLDEREIVRELARQVTRLVACDGVVIAHPDVNSGVVITALRLVRGVERPRGPQPLAAGPIAEVVRSGRAVRIEDFMPANGADDVVGDGEPARSVLAVPMRIGLQLVGVLAVHAEARGIYDADDEEVLQAIASQAGTAIINARLYSESQHERRQSEALAEVARAVSESLRLGEVLRLILRHATALLHAQGASVSLREGESALEVVAGIGTGEPLVGMRVPVRASLAGRAILQGSYIIVNDSTGGEAPADVVEPSSDEARRHGMTDRSAGAGATGGAAVAGETQRTVIVPLVTARGAIGCLSVMDRSTDFTEEDARVLQRLADQVAVAIVNARLFEEVAEATREWSVAFDAVASGMVLLDARGRITRCNARSLQLADVAEATALVGHTFHEVVLGEAEPCDACVHLTAIREGRIVRSTHRSPGRGRIFDILASPHPNGGAVVTFDDVTAHHALAERHRLVLETASDAIVMTDLERRIVFANPAAEALFGRAASLAGLTLADLVFDEMAAAARDHVIRALAGEPQHWESVIVRPDGERRMVAASTAPLRHLGEVRGVVASLRDVTDERRARDAVAHSEARYRNLFETATDAIYTLDASGSFTSVNQATCDISRHAREELLGRSTQRHLDPDELGDVRAHFAAALSGESRRYQCRFLTSDGEWRLLSVTNTPIRTRDEVVGVLGIARDVTEERRRAEALQRSEARYTRLVETASDAIFTVDEHGCFTSINRALERSVGRPRESLIGVRFTDVVDPRDRQACWNVFQRTLAGERTRLEFRYNHHSGAQRDGSIITTPIVEGDKITGGLGVVRDITEEKRFARQMMQQEKLAAVGQLVSGVAHELNNPLAGVIAVSQLLLGQTSAGDQHRSVETIHSEARRAAKIVASLLTFARQHQPERRATDLNQVVLDTVELRRYAMRVRQIELDISLDPELPQTFADGAQLQQVVLSLISNAEQAVSESWPGEKRIIVRTARDGDLLLLRITDTGPGVTSDNVERIFDPFYSTRPAGQGQGLGLSVSDGIVREHGGRIRVESPPAGGASFVVEIPLVDPPERAAEPPPIVQSSSARGRSVLVVDDEPAIRLAIATYLAQSGHNVDAVGSGGEALRRLGQRRYDAIVLDLRMPDMSGDAIYAELEARDPEQAARIVFLTGDVQSESARTFVRATGRPCLSKPFMLDELASLLFAASAS
ncbi:MAG TPA: PAS domain S-box protein [Gemmatimonadaceae bacterium]|nr:PAS domain S-box protein [Gemmatimonadaceae bacterium]